MEGEVGTEVPRPQVPVADYSKKNFYDHLGVKSDASKETLKSSAKELLKKYNPITNPDEIDKYQNVLRSDRILNNDTLKKYYDDYGDLSILICEFFQHYFPYVVEGKPQTYLMSMLFVTFFISILLVVSVTTLIARYLLFFDTTYFLPFTFPILLVVGYLVMVIIRYLNEIKHISGEGEKKEKTKSELNVRNGLSIAKCILLIVFQVALAIHFDKDEKSCFICAFLPYLLFEAVVLYQDFVKFKIGVEGINTGKDVDHLLLRGNVYLRYLIGINNTKCEMNKEGKKGACTYATALYALNIFKTDVARVVQNILLFTALKTNPPVYIVFFLPTILLTVATIGEIILQGKIGYIRGTHESVISFFWATIYVIINLDLILTFYSLDIPYLNFFTHAVLFLLELLLLGGFAVGVLPFVPVMEFKLKHDETEVPL